MSIALSKDEKYFLTRNVTYKDDESEITDASLDELRDRMNACREFYDKFKDEFDRKAAQVTTW